MSNTQKASGNKKGQNKVVSGPKAKKPPVQALVEAKNQASETQAQEGTDFSPIELPVTGPLARKENVEKLVELAGQAGIPLSSDKSGHLISEEQRQGERRQAENDRRQQQQANAAMALSVSQLLANGGNGEPATSAPQAAQAASAPQSAPQASEPDSAANAAAQQQAANIEAFNAEMKKLAEQFGVQVPMAGVTLATTPSHGRPQKNGITRPGNDTKTGLVWRIADEITLAKGSAAGIGDLKKNHQLKDMNDHTIRTQYARWRQFNGVKGRTPSEEAEENGNGASRAQPSVKWPKMTDDDFKRYMDLRSRDQLDAEYAPWLEAEESRRSAAVFATAPQAAPPAAPIAAQSAIPQGPMADEVYNRLLTMKANNTLPVHFEAALTAEKQRRNEK